MVPVPIKDSIGQRFCLIGIFLFPMFPTVKPVKGGLLTGVAPLIFVFLFSFTINLAQFTHDTLKNTIGDGGSTKL